MNNLINKILLPFMITLLSICLMSCFGDIEETKGDEESDCLYAQSNLNIGYAQDDNETNVTQNITLPAYGADRVKIEWTSDNTKIIFIKNNIGVILRPKGDTDAKVKLTATLTKGLVILQKQFNVQVKAAPLEDSDYVVIGFATNDDALHVTRNITLIQNGGNGISISWKSENTNIIDIDGTVGIVTRPAKENPDAVVKLIATYTKNSESKTKTFYLIVKAIPEDESGDVVIAKDALEIGYLTGDYDESVTQDLSLITDGGNGVSISWESDNTNVIMNNGAVTRPKKGAPDAEVLLIATLVKGSMKDFKPFYIIVKALPMEDIDFLKDACKNLEINFAINDDAQHVTRNITLIKGGSNDISISWESNKTEVIANDGSVTRPPENESDAYVVLTATLAKGSISISKQFLMIVKATPLDDSGDVMIAREALKIEFATNDNIQNVTQKLKLITDGGNGISISWKSDNPSVIADDGSVTRPVKGTSNVEVVVTATLVKNAVSKTKSFYLIVKAMP